MLVLGTDKVHSRGHLLDEWLWPLNLTGQILPRLLLLSRREPNPYWRVPSSSIQKDPSRVSTESGRLDEGHCRPLLGTAELAP